MTAKERGEAEDADMRGRQRGNRAEMEMEIRGRLGGEGGRPGAGGREREGLVLFVLTGARGARRIEGRMAASESTDTSLPPGRRAGGRGEVWWLAAVCVLVGWFYVWTARNEGSSWNFGQRQTDYYNLLVDGFLDGHLYMKVEVPEALLKLADPYNPAQRPPGVALHDASMYRGHYYIYFGAAPVVTLMLPFRVLTGGTALPLPAAVAIFTFAGFVVSVGMLRGIRRRYFPEVGTVTVVLGALALGTVSMGPVLVLRGSIWELPLSSGYFYAMVALGCVWRSLHAERRAAWWFAGAGLSLGLAVASRPTYLFTSGLLAAPVLWWWWRARAAGAWAALPWRRVLAGAVPLGAVGLAMAWYNYARFGSPTEFGVAYQFSGIFEAETQHFRWSYFPLNSWMYALQGADWTRYFPFLHRGVAPAIPAGHLGFDDLHGVLPNVPLVWFALLAPLAAWRRGAEERGRLLAGMGAAAMIVAGTVAPLAFFYAAMARYGADFLPALVLLALTGAMAWQRCARMESAGAPRWAAGVALGAAALVSIFFAVMLSFEAYGNLRRLSPRAYARIATWCNFPTSWVEKIAGTKHGAVEVELRWPVVWPAAGTKEMLVSTGSFDAGDHIFVQYESAGRVRIGFVHDGGGRELSREIAADSSGPRRLRVEMGALYPPEEHPFFRSLTIIEEERLTRSLRVEMDGEVLLESYQRFHTSSPAEVVVGRARSEGRVEQAFSGTIVRAAREAEAGSIRTEEVKRRAVRARLSPEGGKTRQPLFTVGGAERGAVWYAVARDGGAMAIGCARANGTAWETAPVNADLGVAHEIEVTWLARPGAAARAFVKVDGVAVGTRSGDETPLEGAIAVGVNETAVGEVAATWAGAIHRLDQDAGVREFDAVRVTLTFPARRGTEREPLVVAGQTGRGDFVFVEYLDSGRVRFGLDHWGKPTVFSAPLTVDFAAPQVIEVALESFPGARQGAALARDPQRIRVAVNGREVWAQEARLFAVGADDVFVGRNPIGGTGCAALFSGAILEVKRLAKPDSVR